MVFDLRVHRLRSPVGGPIRARLTKANASRLALPLVVAVATVPFAGWTLPSLWLASMLALIAMDWSGFGAATGGARARFARVAAWLIGAGYSSAALYLVLFYDGAAQTLGVTLYGVVMFEVLVRDYANPRRLMIDLIPPILSILFVQVAAAMLRLAHHQAAQIVTLLASPFAVLMVFRALQTNLTQSRRRLAEATVRAEAAAVAKSDFLANMSHEIRTPLTAILGFSDMLQRIDTLEDDARLYVQRIATGGRTLLAVVNDILDFSKLEAGQLELNQEPYDPAEVLKSALELVAPQAAAKGLDLALDLDPDLPGLVEGDAPRLSQVLLNLLSNAVKFTSAGAVTLSAGYDAGGRRLRVTVADTGSGIPADKLDRLFERFSQVDGSINRRHGGTGLGLAICKNLVALMGGTIEVASIEGEGSTFSFAIAAPPATRPAAKPCAPQSCAEAAPTGGSAHILVADDLAENRELVRLMLEAVGHRVSEAASGAEAIEAASARPFDLILMDVQMPGMDGLAATRSIHQGGGPNAATPILALSANVMADQVAQCLVAGMRDHIAKPLQVPDLLSKVAYWLDAGDLAEEPAAAAAGG